MKSNKFLGKKTRQSIQSLIITSFFCGILLFSFPQVTFAYDNDTHFWLTFYLARKAGYTNIQATQIASANVSVDYDPATEPVLALPNHWTDLLHPISHFQNVVETFHALPHRREVIKKAKEIDNSFEYHWWSPLAETNKTIQIEADKIVTTRKNGFWKKTILKDSNPGVFLHYEQDVYSHKKFKSWLGHGGYYYVDFLASNPEEAKRMAFNSLKYLVLYRKYQSEKSLNQDLFNTEFVDRLDINTFAAANNISQKDIEEIEEVVEEFINANPISEEAESFEGGYKYLATSLVTKWCNFSPEKKKGHFKFPPLTYVPDLLRNKNKQPVPNSFEARIIVSKRLNKDENLPHIWRYDLQNKYCVKQPEACVEEYLEKTYTKQAYVYNNDYKLPQVNKKKEFLIKDEYANKELTKMRLSNLDKNVKGNKNKRVCLPFALVDKLQTDILPCSKNQ